MSAEALRNEARSLSARGRTLEALGVLSRAKDDADMDALMDDIRAVSTRAIASFNAHRDAGETAEAERYAAALATLAPGNGAMLTAALECNRALGRWNEVHGYALALSQLEPTNVAAHSALAEICKVTEDAEGEIAHRMALALSPDNPLHPLVRLRDLHDAASLILCRPLIPASEAQLETLLAAVRLLHVEADAGSEMEAWETHYRLLLAGVDLAAIRAPTPPPKIDTDTPFVRSTDGKPLDWAGVRAHADRLGAACIFFAAADETYVDLYARWFALSVLKYCGVPCLVVVHVIGGGANLAAIAERVGVRDERLIFAGDTFDAAAITTACHDSPPKGRIERPVAHFQCVRFQRLGDLLRQLERPTFVSDIDLILQRGVADLLERSAGDDLMLNENEASFATGSRLTANLLLANPTPNALIFVDWLQVYLDRALAGAAVTRWIDQLALLLARQHLIRHAGDARIGLFDTASDINNIMYRTYQDHPFRFLSLYHGFDTASLEGEARVLG